MRRLRLVLGIVAVSVLSTAAEPAGPVHRLDYDPIDHYRERQVEGWRVLVNRRLDCDRHRDLCHRTIKHLANHLYRIRRVVPRRAVQELRRIPIWVELAHPRHPCMCYHVSAEWLRSHGMNPEKAGAVEIANAEAFLRWTIDQPWMVLHELAHGYHDQVLGFDQPEVRACYERARSSGAYRSVLRIGGTKQQAYAMQNHREYFAELTEAYFGTNDFYPFVRAELKQHDPAMYDLLGRLWRVGED